MASIVDPASDSKTDAHEALHQQLYDLIVDHPMWIGDDGEPLEYLPEREARIGDFLTAALALPAMADLLALPERLRAVPTYTLSNDGEPLGTVILADDAVAALAGDA